MYLLFLILLRALGCLSADSEEDIESMLGRQLSYTENKAVVSREGESTTFRCQRRENLTIGDWRFIFSPNYPRHYPKNKFHQVECFTSPFGTVMEVYCLIFTLEKTTNCSSEYLFLSLNGSLNSKNVTKFCGDNFSTQTSVTNFLPIGFHTDGLGLYSGYGCVVNVIKKNDANCTALDFVGQKISMTSPNFPSDYPNNYDSFQCFHSPPQTKIWISCSLFHLEDDCEFDYFSILLNNDETTDEVITYCGGPCNISQITESNQLTVYFHTDDIVQEKGYNCTLEVVNGDWEEKPSTTSTCGYPYTTTMTSTSTTKPTTNAYSSTRRTRMDLI